MPNQYQPRLNFVTIGVRDLEQSKAFWKALFGWTPIQKDSKQIAFFDMGGWVLSLFGWSALADDARISAEGQGFRGVTLAHNVRTKEEVAPLLKRAERLGAKIQKAAQDAPWGGHSGYFTDLDGHLWEVAWNPLLPTLENGTLKIVRET